MDELRLEIANARTSEQQTDEAFVLLNRELNKLQEEENLPRNRRSPVLYSRISIPLLKKCMNTKLFLQLLSEVSLDLLDMRFLNFGTNK